jgi:hypothetical protein
MRDPPFKPLLKKAKHGSRGYPLATVMFYGPDDQTATKVAVGIIWLRDMSARAGRTDVAPRAKLSDD